MKASQIISQSLGLLGVRPAGQAADGNELSDLLERLNLLVDSMRVDGLYGYATLNVTGTLSGTTLTIGPTGDIVTPFRPVRIEPGYYTSSDIDYPLGVMTLAEWNGIGQKAYEGTGPTGVWYEPTLPNGTLHFYPQADGVTVTIPITTHLSEFADLDTDYTLAPGYARMLMYALAEDIAPDFQAPLSPLLLNKGAALRRAVRKANHVVPTLKTYWPTGNYPGNVFGGPTADIYDGGNAGSP